MLAALAASVIAGRAEAQVGPPVNTNKTYIAPYQTRITLLTPGVIGFDTAIAATVELVSPPANGLLELAPTGGFSFTPAPGFVGDTSFTYRASNYAGRGNVATITVTVLSPDVPVLAADTYETGQGVPLVVPAPGVLTNDSSPNGSPLSAALQNPLGTTAGGTVSLRPDGGFTYTPRPTFSGRDGFSYIASNAAGTGRTVFTTINVVPSPTEIQAPSGLFARSLVGNTLSLQWTMPAGGVAPTSFRIEGGITSGQVLASVGTFTAAPSITFDVPNGSFYLRVRAVANGQTGPPSNEIRIHVNQPFVPSSSTRLLGLATGTTLTLSWKNAVATGELANVLLDVAGPLSRSIPVGASDRFRFEFTV